MGASHTRLIGAVLISMAFAACRGGGGVTPPTTPLPQAREAMPQSATADCTVFELKAGLLGELRHAGSAACGMLSSESAAAPLNALASSTGIITFDVPGAAESSDCQPFELNFDCGTNAYAINDDGTVTGFYLDEHLDGVGFIRSAGGQFTSFQAPGAGNPHAGSTGYAINDAGEISGQVLDRHFTYHAFIREPDGKFVNADAPFASYDPQKGMNQQGSYISSMNARGDTAGFWFDEQGLNSHAFIRSEDGTFVQVDPPGAVSESICFEECLNDPGSATGDYNTGTTGLSFIRTAGGSYTKIKKAGAKVLFMSGIDDRGNTVGAYQDSKKAWWGFIRDAQGSFVSFQAPHASLTAGHGTQVAAINGTGAVTGIYFDSTGATHGFYRSQNGRFAEFDPSGSTSTLPSQLNDSGEVVGGWHDARGGVHGFLWIRH